MKRFPDSPDQAVLLFSEALIDNSPSVTHRRAFRHNGILKRMLPAPSCGSAMKAFASLLTSLILALWIGVIAVISVQNFSPVSLRLLNYQSFEVPLGLVLAAGVMIGVVGAAIVQPIVLPTGFDDDDDY